ncbi:MAG TPA: hypothetical protein DCG28_03555 [Lachnospiraceae bacterium]|nr:hypothetical protein [Lachnospiraceae bacterium]
MIFDTISMKQRAKEILKYTNPSYQAVCALPTVLFIVYWCIFIFFKPKAAPMLILIGFTLINSLFRSSIDIYGLKLSRGEETSISDIFAIFKEDQLTYILVSIMRAALEMVGYYGFGIGAYFMFSIFRFAVYAVKDGEKNPLAALAKSFQLAKGKSDTLLKCDITNIVDYIIFSCFGGISAFRFMPKMSLFYAELYEFLKEENV